MKLHTNQVKQQLTLRKNGMTKVFTRKVTELPPSCIHCAASLDTLNLDMFLGKNFYIHPNVKCYIFNTKRPQYPDLGACCFQETHSQLLHPLEQETRYTGGVAHLAYERPSSFLGKGTAEV